MSQTPVPIKGRNSLRLSFFLILFLIVRVEANYGISY